VGVKILPTHMAYILQLYEHIHVVWFANLKLILKLLFCIKSDMSCICRRSWLMDNASKMIQHVLSHKPCTMLRACLSVQHAVSFLIHPRTAGFTKSDTRWTQQWMYTPTWNHHATLRPRLNSEEMVSYAEPQGPLAGILEYYCYIKDTSGC